MWVYLCSDFKILVSVWTFFHEKVKYYNKKKGKEIITQTEELGYNGMLLLRNQTALFVMTKSDRTLTENEQAHT